MSIIEVIHIGEYQLLEYNMKYPFVFMQHKDCDATFETEITKVYHFCKPKTPRNRHIGSLSTMATVVVLILLGRRYLYIL